MKNKWISILLFVSLFILSACTSQSASVKTGIQPKQSTTSENSDKTNDSYQDFIIIQTDNQGFPQSQGVYDFHDGSVHIVKQYIPEGHTSQADTRLQIAQEERVKEALENDFKKHFAKLNFQNDPYYVYETTYTDCTIRKTDEDFTISSKEFTIKFNWVDKKHTILLDTNHVLYQIYQ